MNTKVTLSAIELLGQWNRISQVHLSLGSGCMCSGSMPGLAVSDLEIDILEFLKEKYRHEKEFLTWLKTSNSMLENTSVNISQVLKNFAIQPPSTSLAMKILGDLKNTIASLNETHKGWKVTHESWPSTCSSYRVITPVQSNIEAVLFLFYGHTQIHH